MAADDRRVVALPEALLQALHGGSSEATSEQTRQLLYGAGYEWGLQEMLHFSRGLREELGSGSHPDLWHMEPSLVFERWAGTFIAAGWGGCSFDLSAHGQGLAFVEVRQSAVATAVGRAGAPTCHLYAGLLAGTLSFYHRAETHAVETECAALGHACCRFIVGPGSLIDRAETARRSGEVHETIRHLVLEAQPAAPATGSNPGHAPVASPAPSPATASTANIPWKK